MIKINVDYQTHFCSKMHNQPDNCTEVRCEMQDSLSHSINFFGRISYSNNAHFNLLEGLRLALIPEINVKFSTYLSTSYCMYSSTYIHYRFLKDFFYYYVCLVADDFAASA